MTHSEQAHNLLSTPGHVGIKGGTINNAAGTTGVYLSQAFQLRLTLLLDPLLGAYLFIYYSLLNIYCMPGINKVNKTQTLTLRAHSPATVKMPCAWVCGGRMPVLL